MGSRTPIRMIVHFSGVVQGVGFRFTTVTAARPLPVTGFVENLADGRVKMTVEGSEEDIEALIDRVREATHGHIAGIDRTQEQPTGSYSGFEIRNA